MYCKNCGRLVPNDALFCAACGNPMEETEKDVDKKSQETKKKRGLGRNFWIGVLAGTGCCAILFGILSAIVLFPSAGTAGKVKYEGNGFNSPEEAVIAYMDGLKNCDIAAMLSTFSIETYAENYNAMRMAEYTWRYYLHNTNNTTEFGEEISVIRRCGEVAEIAHNTLLYFKVNGTKFSDVADGYGTEFYDETFDSTSCNEFFSILSDTKTEESFSEMKIGRVLGISDVLNEKQMEYYETDYYREHEAEKTEIYGYDELMPVAIEVEIDGKDYLFFMDVACYNGRWYNFGISNSLSGSMDASNYAGWLLCD